MTTSAAALRCVARICVIAISEKPALSYNRFGGFLGGPVRLPGIYNGHDRTFFSGAVEWLYDEFPEPGPRTVPTDAIRNGDFSAFLSQGTIICDPASTRAVGSRIVRTSFPLPYERWRIRSRTACWSLPARRWDPTRSLASRPAGSSRLISRTARMRATLSAFSGSGPVNGFLKRDTREAAAGTSRRMSI